MDTQETGTAAAVNDETVTDATSVTEDADTRRIEDKKKYLSDLDREIKEKEALRNKAKKSEPEDEDDVMTWLTVNSDDLKLVNKEYKEELAFYKNHKIPVTNEIRDRALREAKNKKGVRPSESEQQVSSPSLQGETRKAARTTDVPASLLKMSPSMTPEKYAKLQAEMRADGLKV